MRLSNQLAGEIVKVNSINFDNKYIHHRLNNIGITKNTLIKVLNYPNDKKNLHLLVYGVEYVIREVNCHGIDVEKTKQ